MAKCERCGGSIRSPRKMCRPCWLAQAKRVHCLDCGKEIGRDGQQRCRPCWMVRHTAHTSRPVCCDCGKLISWQVGRRGNPARRCWDCELERRKANRIVVLREKAARTDQEHPDNRHNRHQRSQAIPFRKLLGPWPCALCGYHLLPSRVHRINARLGYIVGNVVQVCSRCHDEIHAGILPTPSPNLAAFPAL
jgi:hypothetical protein